MTELATRPATYADLEAVPPHLVAEIVDGVLYTHPRPVARHGAASFALANVVGGPFQLGRGGPGGWVFIDEPELHLGPHVVVPDLAGWGTDRMPVVPDAPWIELIPDWICEILSPSTEKMDRGRKRRIYATYSLNTTGCSMSRSASWKPTSCATVSLFWSRLSKTTLKSTHRHLKPRRFPYPCCCRRLSKPKTRDERRRCMASAWHRFAE